MSGSLETIMTDPGPSSLPRKPTASSVLSPTDVNDSSISQLSNICAFCSNESKYTCPRCSVKTCSLACSKSHKTSTGCTGERDRAAYIPMNTYTWGTLADDYVFLEEMGRNATTWGRDIVSTGRGRGRGGKRGGKTGRGVLSPKCETLRVQLAARDIGISFVADGMEKRRLSQSLWDVRTKTAHLTVEFIFHLKDPNQKDKKNTSATVSLLTHRNDLATPLTTSLVSHLKRKSDVPASVLDLVKISSSVLEGPLNLPPGIFFAISQLERPKPGAIPVQYQAPSLPIRMTSQHAPTSMPSHVPDPMLKPQKVFYHVDPSNSLQSCLRDRSFVEWPTIDVFPSQQVFTEGKFGVLADGAGGLAISPPREEGPNKRRKTETGLVQLVGGYGEEDGSEAEAPSPQYNRALGIVGLGIAGLGDYASDEDKEEDGVDAGL